MSKKTIKRAAREGRVAVLPAWLSEGKTVWYWRGTLCGDDLCLDMVGPSCPMNHGAKYFDREAKDCARCHPVLDHMEIYDVRAVFTPRGIRWAVNDLDDVADIWLRTVFFPTREDALSRRPRRIEYG